MSCIPDTEELDEADHRLAELEDIVSKDELPVVPDAKENRDGIAEQLFSISGDVGLQGRFCTVLAVSDMNELSSPLETKRPLYILLVVRTPRLYPCSWHSGLSTDHQHRYTQMYLSRFCLEIPYVDCE